MRTGRLQTTILALAMASAAAYAQDPQSSGGWRRVTDPAPATAPAPPPPAPQVQAENAPPPPPMDTVDTTAAPPAPEYGQARDAYGQPRQAPPPMRQAYPQQPQQRPLQPATVPAELTIAPGTFITARVDQMLSSDHNQPGDTFSATLLKPIVVDGFVVAQPGQTIAGRITEVQKAGRVSGTSRLALELSDLTAVDGQQVRMHSQLMNIAGGTSKGRDAQAIGTTTGLGAAIGAVADGGQGAAIGAGAGAAASVIGVLLTRGRASVIYPESVLTFRVDNPVVISTARAPQAFHIVDPREYSRENQAPRLQTRVVQQPAPYYAYPYPYGWYGPSYYPYYWGPSVGFYYGRGYYRRGRW